MDMEQFIIPGAGNFQFSAVGLDNLGASEYTIVNIVVDITGSLCGFENELLRCVKEIVEACKKSPRAENLLIRLVNFNEDIIEVHGFKLLSTIDTASYKVPVCGGKTASIAATHSAIGSVVEYAEKLMESDYMCNGIVIVLTDGDDNMSMRKYNITAAAVGQLIGQVRRQEKQIESLLTILIAFNYGDSYMKQKLEAFSADAAFDQFVDAGECTPQNMAKIAGFVSKSISSQSQSLGTGGASQPLTW